MKARSRCSNKQSSYHSNVQQPIPLSIPSRGITSLSSHHPLTGHLPSAVTRTAVATARRGIAAGATVIARVVTVATVAARSGARSRMAVVMTTIASRAAVTSRVRAGTRIRTRVATLTARSLGFKDALFPYARLCQLDTNGLVS